MVFGAMIVLRFTWLAEARYKQLAGEQDLTCG